MLRVDGLVPYADLMVASDEELETLWDSFVLYCEEREAAIKRQTEQSRGR